MFSMTALARFSYLDLGSCKRCCIVEIIDDGVVLAIFCVINAIYQILPFGHRQFVALNPFLKSESVISQSVAEHATTTITQSFSFFSILLIFSGLGAWFLLVNRDKMKTYLPNIPFDMAVYALILSIMGVYLSSAFIRLELYTTIATSVLASIAIAIIRKIFLRQGVKTTHQKNINTCRGVKTTHTIKKTFQDTSNGKDCICSGNCGSFNHTDTDTRKLDKCKHKVPTLLP